VKSLRTPKIRQYDRDNGMAEPLAFLNGRWVHPAELSVPVWDAGFVQGVTVAEQLRTFQGRLFRLDVHLQRLKKSLDLVGIDLGEMFDRLAEHAVRLVHNNHTLLPPGSDLGLSIFVTPGPYAAFAPPIAERGRVSPRSGPQPDARSPVDEHGPTVGMHTYPVPFRIFAAKYEHGERLATTDVTQVPNTCWPAALKCRSRMHYYLADRQAKHIDPPARALMTDLDGFVTEASTANLVLYRRDSGFVSPPRDKILPGVSVGTLEELAQHMAIPFVFRDVTVKDVLHADEALLSSTSPCLLPVVALNNQSIGGGQPGALFQRAIAAWSQLVGIDIVRQAQQFGSEPAETADET
jgi:branched-chain amino acid aminotransferase